MISVKLILKKIKAKLSRFWDKLIKSMKKIAEKLKEEWNIFFLGCKTFIKKIVDATSKQFKRIYEMIIRAYKYFEGRWLVKEKEYEIPEEQVPEEIRRNAIYYKEVEMSDKTELVLKNS